VAPNLLLRDFSAEAPTTKWVADTTYIWTAEGWLYLAVVLDVFSRTVGGWSMAAIQDATLVSQALRMAIARRRPQAGLLHHTDRGRTSTSQSYQALLLQEGMVVSMSRTADCYDNAAVESFFHSFKGECIDGQSFQTRTQARSITFDYIEAFYNRTRRHSTLHLCWLHVISVRRMGPLRTSSRVSRSLLIPQMERSIETHVPAHLHKGDL
jgi:putative transposase